MLKVSIYRLEIDMISMKERKCTFSFYRDRSLPAFSSQLAQRASWQATETGDKMSEPLVLVVSGLKH